LFGQEGRSPKYCSHSHRKNLAAGLAMGLTERDASREVTASLSHKLRLITQQIAARLRSPTRSGESPVYPPSKKYSHFSFYPNHLRIPCRLVPQRGGSRSSRTRGGMRWTRAHQARERDGRAGRKACERSNGARTNDVACGRRSRVVLTPRRWRQGGGRHLCPTGL
jgi:hypothetical protein